jgi:hypothetical protein
VGKGNHMGPIINKKTDVLCARKIDQARVPFVRRNSCC